MQSVLFNFKLFKLLLIYIPIPVIAQTDTSIATTTTVSDLSPPALTFVPGDDQWQLLGCYNDISSNGSDGAALGSAGTYISPILGSPYFLTVPICLGSCGEAVTLDGSEYFYAAVENSHECYCGLTLSSYSVPQSNDSCSSPCAADPNTSCGGYGYITLYQKQTVLKTANATSTLSHPNSTSVTTRVSLQKHMNTTAIWVGVGVGLTFLSLLAVLLVHLEKRYYKYHRHHHQSITATNFPPINGVPFKRGHEVKLQTLNKVQRTQQTGNFNDKGSCAIVSDRQVNCEELEFIAPPPIFSEIQTEAAGRRRRETFDAWKKGSISSIPAEFKNLKVSECGRKMISVQKINSEDGLRREKQLEDNRRNDQISRGKELWELQTPQPKTLRVESKELSIEPHEAGKTDGSNSENKKRGRLSLVKEEGRGRLRFSWE